MKVVVHSGSADDPAEVREAAAEFVDKFKPIGGDEFHVLQDKSTGAFFSECYVSAKAILANGTIDVPLDPDASPDYRANRDIVESAVAFQRMKADARIGRSFSNIVCEFVPTAKKTLQIIGGQHRYEAIRDAMKEGVSELHGIKVYFLLDSEQRLDVQIISNTNIAVSKDLLDRMYETMSGPELRDWCQRCGLLGDEQDFADTKQRGKPITVSEARTFIVNYYAGADVELSQFDEVETIPDIIKPGERDPESWMNTKVKHPDLWKDAGLEQAAKEYARLTDTQLAHFYDDKLNKFEGSVDARHKASNSAVLSAWAFTAGMLQKNQVRLAKHYALANKTTKDPLRADLLARGRHVTDPENYRGLGFRTDSKERGRLVELFALQAEDGGGFTKKLIDVAILSYHAKEAQLQKLKRMGKS